MNNTAIFQGLISSRPPDLAQAQRQNTRARFLFLLYSLPVSLAMGAFAWFLLWKLTETDQWEGFWSTSSWGAIFLLSVPPLVLLLLPAIFLVRQGHDAETATRALPLREAARRGDDTPAPLDTQQSTAAESVAWAASAPWQARLRRADTSAQNHRLMLGGVLSALAGYSETAHALADLLRDFGSMEVVITWRCSLSLGSGWCSSCGDC